MAAPLRVLLVEDVEDDALLLVRELRKGGYDVAWTRVETASEMRASLRDGSWDAIVSDYSLPSFDAPAAMEVLKTSGLDLPFLIVSRHIGEDLAVAAMKAGAHDYIMKANLTRLVPAVEREIRDAAVRAQRRSAEEKLHKRERLFGSLIENASDIINVLDATGRIQYSSPSVLRLLGYSPEELRGQRALDFVHPDDAEQASAKFERILEPGIAELPVELRIRHQDGRWRFLEATTSNLLHDPNLAGIVVNSRDVSERKRDEETIRHLAFYDALTGLPNRRLFGDRLAQALAYARRHSEELAVLSLDVDRFKNINDSLGHASGDQFLRCIGERLTAGLREGDTISRFGGDEFVILLSTVESAQDAVQIARKILDLVSKPLHEVGSDFHLSASLGISLFPRDGNDEQALIQNAGAALHRAKKSGGGSWALYAPAMNEKALERLVLENAFRRSLEIGEFVLHYQPQVDVSTGEVTGVEALARWRHPELGLLPPDQFIPLAEETGLIVALENWVLDEACRQGRRWQDAGLPPIRVAVNLCARHLKQADLLETVDGALQRTGLPARCLELELTESIVMDEIEDTVAKLVALKSRGVQLSIDDFGTGYSSLSYLKRLPIERIKIDQSFIRDIPSDEDAAAIVRLIIAIAHSLKLKVIAEGVENREQLEFLTMSTCNEMQGFLFSEPRPASKVESLLASDAVPFWTAKARMG